MPASKGSGRPAGSRRGRGGEPSDPAADVPVDAHAHERLDVGAFIRGQRELARMSVRRLAELADVSNPYLSQIERGLRKPSAEILQQVANALRISVETLYVKAGILPEEAVGVSTVAEAIDADARLTAEQKQALRNVYESFLAGR